MTDTSSHGTFIKSEPDDSHTFHQYMMNNSDFNMGSNNFGQSFNGHAGQHNGNVDPNELSMDNNNYNLGGYGFGGQQNMTGSFNLGNSGIGDDELLDLELHDANSNNQGRQASNDFGQSPLAQNGHVNYFADQRPSIGMSMSHQSGMSNMYSSTPDGAPIQSPFVNQFNYDQFRPLGQQLASPRMGNGQNFESNYINMKRPSLQTDRERKSSDGRSPMTPKTPAMGALNIGVGTPESGSFPNQSMRTNTLQSRHQKTLSNQWDGTPASASPFLDSPISSSPGTHAHHAGISEILKSGGKSLPTKPENGSGMSALESQEAKRRRRRASHNMVERRRRDNINERIQDLSHLVPLHRLEDDKVRKQLANNSPLSPTLGPTGISPPSAATSLLAGGNGRRATGGSITMGLPLDDKEKGPNKGDILNGAVSWTRDLMWMSYRMIQQQAELEELITQLGGTYPFDRSEEEQRMRTEILEAMQKNDPETFVYSRAPGSGLRVPNHTNYAGDAVNQNNNTGTLSPQSLSPAFHSGGSGTNSGGQQPQFWNSSGHAGISFKEEDEYSMEMN